MSALMRTLDRRFGVLIILGGALLVAASVWSAVADDPVEDEVLRRAVLTEGDYTAVVSFNKGADKPRLETADGRVLLDVSGWESVLTVNGESRVLYRHEFNWATDGNVAYVTWSDPAYSLQQRIALGEDGLHVTWSWLRAPAAPPQNVTLEVAHFAYHMVDPAYADGVAHYTLSAEDPMHPLDVTDARGHAVTAAFDPAPASVRFGEMPDGRVDALRTTYRLEDPRAGAVTPIATMHVTASRTPGPVAPPEPLPDAEASLRDATPQALEFPAGENILRFLMNQGAGKPILQTRDARTLLDLSASESRLRIDGGERTLHAHAFTVREGEGEAVITWHHEAYTLEQHVRATEDGFTAAWSWTRAPDAPAQDVELEIAHFARFMLDPVHDGDGVRYGLSSGGGDGTDRAFTVHVKPDTAPEDVWFGETPGGDVDAFRFVYRLDDPPAGERVPVATLDVSVDAEGSR